MVDADQQISAPTEHCIVVQCAISDVDSIEDNVTVPLQKCVLLTVQGNANRQKKLSWCVYVNQPVA
jgi:hypothetical protein